MWERNRIAPPTTSLTSLTSAFSDMTRLAVPGLVLVACGFLLVTVLAENRCPKRCRCFKRGFQHRVDCSFLGLKKFPRTLPLDVTYLSLENNNIKEIPDSTLYPLLRDLNLARNSISRVDHFTFAAMTSLQILDLSGNELEALSSNSFISLFYLKELRLSGNKFSSMDNVTASFTFLDRLQKLFLSGNRRKLAGGLSNNQFSQLVSLKELDLSYLHLQSLPNEVFGRLRKLQKLDISYNDLEEFPYRALSTIPYQYIDLRHNRIRHFGHNSIGSMKIPSFNNLRIEGNPLVCDCTATFLWQRLREGDPMDDVIMDVVCNSPPPVSGKQLYYLKKEDLVCDRVLCFAATPANVTYACMGMPAVIDCEVDGLSGEMIKWEKNGVRLPVSDNDVCQTKYHRTCTGSLVIRDVQLSDLGEYRCLAGEGAGETVSPPGRLRIISSCYNNSETPAPTTVAPTPTPTPTPTSPECYDNGSCAASDESGSGFEPKPCPCPPNVSNSIVNSNCSETKGVGKHLPDDEVTYKCKQGYVLSENHRLVCRSDGKWKGEQPCCALACKSAMVDNELLFSKARDLTGVSSSSSSSSQLGGCVINDDFDLLTKGKLPPVIGQMRMNGEPISCDVTLISNTLGMTAANCVAKPNAEQPYDLRQNRIEITFGKRRLNPVDDEMAQQIRFVKKIYIHSRYAPNTLEYNVALLRLDVPVSFNQHVRPTCLPKSSWSFESRDADKVSVSGLSHVTTKTGDDTSLRKAIVVVANRSTCRKVMRSVEVATESMICAYGPCHGVGGGPLVVLVDDFWYVIGVTSWGDRCGTSGQFGVYARVTHPNINKWIHKIKEDDES